MSGELYYDELDDEAKKRAAIFLTDKYREIGFNHCLHCVEDKMLKRGIKTSKVMFDVADPANVKIHVTGEFVSVPHQVGYPAARLRTPKFYIVANNRAVVSAITPDAESWNAAITAEVELNRYYNKARAEVEAVLSRVVSNIQNKTGSYTDLFEDFAENSGYVFDVNGYPLEE